MRRPQRRIPSLSDRLPNAFALAGDTDSVDGAEEIAWAIVTSDTLARVTALVIDAKALLANNEGRIFLDVGLSGNYWPNPTDVNDFRAKDHGAIKRGGR